MLHLAYPHDCWLFLKIVHFVTGSISMEDVLSVAPFQNTIDIVELKGSHIKEMFEHSVRNYDPIGIDLPGGFLQVSGMISLRVFLSVVLASASVFKLF